jgi:hypothetical protein
MELRSRVVRSAGPTLALRQSSIDGRTPQRGRLQMAARPARNTRRSKIQSRKMSMSKSRRKSRNPTRTLNLPFTPLPDPSPAFSLARSGGMSCVSNARQSKIDGTLARLASEGHSLPLPRLRVGLVFDRVACSHDAQRRSGRGSHGPRFHADPRQSRVTACHTAA